MFKGGEKIEEIYIADLSFDIIEGSNVVASLVASAGIEPT